MSASIATLRPAARADVETATLWYVEQGGEALGVRFMGQVQAALDHISRYPASSSTRYGAASGHPGLRFWPVKGFPYLVFYRDAGGWLDAWRVLHAERDIPAWLREE